MRLTTKHVPAQSKITFFFVFTNDKDIQHVRILEATDGVTRIPESLDLLEDQTNGEEKSESHQENDAIEQGKNSCSFKNVIVYFQYLVTNSTCMINDICLNDD